MINRTENFYIFLAQLILHIVLAYIGSSKLSFQRLPIFYNLAPSHCPMSVSELNTALDMQVKVPMPDCIDIVCQDSLKVSLWV